MMIVVLTCGYKSKACIQNDISSKCFICNVEVDVEYIFNNNTCSDDKLTARRAL